MFFVIISIGIYIFRIYLILVLSNCNAIQSTDCNVRYFNKLSIYFGAKLTHLGGFGLDVSFFSHVKKHLSRF